MDGELNPGPGMRGVDKMVGYPIVNSPGRVLSAHACCCVEERSYSRLGVLVDIKGGGLERLA